MDCKKKYLYKNLSETAQLHEAIIFATRAHKGQLRKASDLDYICHPLEVLQILTTMKADTKLLIAGVLHDVVEDTMVSTEQVEEMFGEEIAGLVAGHTEDKNHEWEVRKLDMIDRVAKGDRRLKMLVMADKISNLRSIASDLRVIGECVWDKFNVPKEKEFWYYTTMGEALKELESYEETATVYKEMMQLHKEVFKE